MGSQSEERKIGCIVRNNFPYVWHFHIQTCKVTVRESLSYFGIFLSHAESVSGIPRLSTEGNPRGHSPVLLMFFFFFFKALVYRRHTNDHAETWWEQEGRLWYRVPMATIQNGMHSPWQQSWRGNIAETASELVLASGCLKWCMHGSSTAFAHDGSWTQTYHFCGRILAIMAKMYISKHAILFCSGA